MANWDEDQVDEGGDEDTFQDDTVPYDDDEHIDWDNNEEPEGAD